MKKNYNTPEIVLKEIFEDIITYSETEEWVGPEINAGFEGD